MQFELPSHHQHGVEIFKKMFGDVIESENVATFVMQMLESVSRLQEALGSSGGIHIFADRPSHFEEGVLVGSAVSVLFSPIVSLTSSSGIDRGSLSVLHAVRKLRDELELSRVETIAAQSINEPDPAEAAFSSHRHKRTKTTLSQDDGRRRKKQREPLTSVQQNECQITTFPFQNERNRTPEHLDLSNAQKESPEKMRQQQQQTQNLELRSVPSHVKSQDKCRYPSILEWAVDKRRLEELNHDLYVSEKYLGYLEDVNDNQLRALYRDTLRSLLLQIVQNKNRKQRDKSRFPFSYVSLTPPWFARHIRSEKEEAYFEDHAIVNPFFGQIDKIRLILASFIENEPIAVPIVSKLKVAMSLSPIVHGGTPKENESSNKMIEEGKTQQSSPQQTDPQPQHSRQDHSSPQTRPTIALSPRTSPITLSNQKHKKRVVRERNSSQADRLSPKRKKVMPNQSRSELPKYGCANGPKCFMAQDREAQDPSYITGSCTDCKRKLHDRCGRRNEGDEPLICLRCKSKRK